MDQTKDTEPSTSSNIVDIKTTHSGKWLSFKTITLQANSKMIKDYEYIERTTKANKFGLDGVSIIAIVKSKSTSSRKIIIEANFRPPVNKYILELPGGLVEADAGIEDALRELKEETGFVGKPFKNGAEQLTFPALYFDPWKSTEKGRFVMIEVDADDEINKNPKQHLDETEEIIVHLMDLDNNFLKNLEELSEKHGYGIDTQLYCFGLGLSMFSWGNLSNNKF